MLDITLKPPTKRIEDMTPAEQEVEVASLEAGVCIPNLGPFGHIQIGAPLHGEKTVPVARFEGRGVVRYIMNAADAATLCAMIPHDNWKHFHN